MVRLCTYNEWPGDKCYLKQSSLFGDIDISLHNEKQKKVSLFSGCKTYNYNILRIMFWQDILVYLYLKFSQLLHISSYFYNKTANGVPLVTDHSFCQDILYFQISLYFNNINSQLDATIIILLANFNQLNIFRAIISPILRSTRLCLQLVV